MGPWKVQEHFRTQGLTVDGAQGFFFLCLFVCFLFIYLFLFLAALGLHCRALAFSSCGERGYSSLWCVGFSLWWLLLLWRMGSRVRASVVVAHRLSCPAACGIFPDQGSNPCPLHWQAESYPLSHQGSPTGFLTQLGGGPTRHLPDLGHRVCLCTSLHLTGFPLFLL